MKLFSYTDYSKEQTDRLRHVLALRYSTPVDKVGRITISAKLHADILNSCNRATIIPLSADIFEIWDESYFEDMNKVSEEDVALMRSVFFQAMAKEGEQMGGRLTTVQGKASIRRLPSRAGR